MTQQNISILFAIINNKKCIHNQSRCIFGSLERPLATFIIILLEGKFRKKSKALKCPKTDMSGKGFVAVCVASIESNSTFRNDFARHVRFGGKLKQKLPRVLLQNVINK